jgi:hypothetical protein
MYQQPVDPAEAVDRPTAEGSGTAACTPEVGEPALERGDILSLPRVLARIPDLDAVEDYCETEPAPRRESRGRLFRQALSTRVLLGLTALLMLAALVPLSRMKSKDANSTAEPKPALPAAAPTAVADKTFQPSAPPAPAPQPPRDVSGGPQLTQGPAAVPFSGTPSGGMPPSGAANSTNPIAPPQNAVGSDLAGPPRGNAATDPAAAAGSVDASPWPDPTRSPPLDGALRLISPPDRKATSGPEMASPAETVPGRYELSRPGPVYSEPYRPETPPPNRMDPPGDYRTSTRPLQGSPPPGLAEPALVPPAQGDGSVPWPAVAPNGAPGQETNDKPSIRTDYDRARSGLH